jgi:NAD(P)-dependent dehydrogenase (short-subunit alcohol dehydrogenase family)
MAESLEQRVALISGAAQGIGLGIARSLARGGLKVALTDVNAEEVARSATVLQKEGVLAIGVELDVRLTSHWESAGAEVVKTWGRIDVLVNNAGISPRGTVASTPEALWDQTMAINLKGPWLGIKSTLPWLIKSRGAIINVGSTRATRPMPGLYPYVISKAGLWGLTRQTAVELLEQGVTCNMVAPGWVDTPGERIIQANHGRPNFPEGVANLTTPEDVGDAVLFLVSRAGRKVNGVTLYLDSGLSVADDAGMVYLPDVHHTRYHKPGSENRDRPPS